MTDHTKCPACDVAQQALDAARRFVATGVKEVNPYTGFKLEQAWRSAYERYLLQLSAADIEGGA